MPARDPFAPGEVIAGRYEIRSKLGKGGFGTVFQALHRELGKDVALKVLNPELSANEIARERFLKEVEATTSFVHKYAVQLRDFGHDAAKGVLYFTMDLVPGETLRAILEREKRLDEARAARLVGQVLEVLEEAHDHGLIHRDLKPENLIVTKNHRGQEEIRVLDFGIAKAIAASRDSTGGLTAAGTTLGTLFYMSPEQDEGKKLDGRSDLYSLGVVLYECVSGKRPIEPDPEAENQVQSFHFRLATIEPEPLGASAGFSAVVMKALSKKREGRYESARAMRDALAALGGGASSSSSRISAETSSGLATGGATSTGLPTGGAPSAPPPTSAPSAARPPSAPPARRSRAPLVALGVLVAAAGTALVLGPPDAKERLLASLGTSPPAPPPPPPPPPPAPVPAPPPATPKNEVEERLAAVKIGVVVRTSPEGALILLDDTREVGPAPQGVADLSPGKHKVVATLEGYKDAEQTFELAASARVDVALTLEALTGAVSVTTLPSVAVELDALEGPHKGAAPLRAEAAAVVTDAETAKERAAFPRVPVGRYRARATRDGFEPATAELEVHRGRSTSIDLVPVERPGKLVVRSTPDGLAVKLDGAAAGETTVNRKDVPGGWHTVTVDDGIGHVVSARVHVKGDVPAIQVFDIDARRRALDERLAGIEWTRHVLEGRPEDTKVRSAIEALVAAQAWPDASFPEAKWIPAEIARLRAARTYTHGQLVAFALQELEAGLGLERAKLQRSARPAVLTDAIAKLDAARAGRAEVELEALAEWRRELVARSSFLEAEDRKLMALEGRGIVVVRATTYAVPSGQTARTTQNREPLASIVGAGFYVRKDTVLTSKELVKPELFDPRALAVSGKPSLGWQVETSVEILEARDGKLTLVGTTNPALESRTAIVENVGGDIDDSPRNITVDFRGQSLRVEVRPHTRGRSCWALVRLTNHVGTPLEIGDTLVEQRALVLPPADSPGKREPTAVVAFADDLTLDEGGYADPAVGAPILRSDGAAIGMITAGGKRPVGISVATILGSLQTAPAAPASAEAPSDERAFLGVTLSGETEGRVVVEQVAKDSPAGKAGIQSGDRLLAMNGRRLTTSADLLAFTQSSRPGDTVKVIVLRDGKELDLSVVLGRRPAPDREAPPKPPYLGVRLVEQEGALVVDEVIQGSPAQRSGFRKGDVLITVATTRVSTLQAFEEDMKGRSAGHTVEYQIRRSTGNYEKILVLLGARDDTPAPAAPAQTIPQLGITVGDGLRVEAVDRNQIGWKLGFKVGDVVSKVDNCFMTSVTALVGYVAGRPGGSLVTFELKRNDTPGEPRTVTVQWTVPNKKP